MWFFNKELSRLRKENEQLRIECDLYRQALIEIDLQNDNFLKYIKNMQPLAKQVLRRK